jgi:hypothetical protein
MNIERTPLLDPLSAENVKTAKPTPTLSQNNTYSAGIIDGREYGGLSGFTHKMNDFWPLHIPIHRQKRVIIVGAGVSGIQQATVLIRDKHLNHGDIQLFDALDGYGGVWNKNKYPGCACDVPAMIYTTSYFVNKSKWTFIFTRSQTLTFE